MHSELGNGGEIPTYYVGGKYNSGLADFSVEHGNMNQHRKKDFDMDSSFTKGQIEYRPSEEELLKAHMTMQGELNSPKNAQNFGLAYAHGKQNGKEGWYGSIGVDGNPQDSKQNYYRAQLGYNF